MTVILEIKNVNKAFKKKIFFKKTEKQVLRDINIQIQKSHIFGLTGLNGVGKTTIIKAILDLMPIDSGSISIFGIDHRLPLARQNICYLPEKFYPSPYLTGYEFLDLSLSFYKKKVDKKKAQMIASKLDLNPQALEQVIKKYSKGMGQKLGLISCLLSDAQLLILDEPMTGLDPKARISLKKSLKEYINAGKTVFFSSHILDDVEEICDEIAVLHNGKIYFNDTPDNFKKKYNENKAEKAFLKCIDG